MCSPSKNAWTGMRVVFSRALVRVCAWFLCFSILVLGQSSNIDALEESFGAEHDSHGPTLDDIRNSMQDQVRTNQDMMMRMKSASLDGVTSGGSAGNEMPLIVQDVVFIVAHKLDGTGKVPYSALVAQVEELNRDFSGEDARSSGYVQATDAKVRFNLIGVRYIANDEFHSLCQNTDAQELFRPRYMADGAKNLNIYVCHAATNLGLSWLPYQSYGGIIPDEKHFALGVTVHWELLPNNTLLGGRWNKGKICTHEVGHHYGLRHLYDGGCDLPEEYTDQIGDTPRQSGNPTGSCSALKGRNSCPNKPGLDDNSNYMGIAFDACRNHFTPGQVTFMQNTILARKPTLVSQLPSDCVAAVDSTDYSPDLSPCLQDRIYSNEVGRRWCRTDPDNKHVWAWACCPERDIRITSSSPSSTEMCRQGAPNFDLPDDIRPAPLGGPTDSPTLPTKAPTNRPTALPTPPPMSSSPTPPTTSSPLVITKTPTSSGASGEKAPRCMWTIVKGGPMMENAKCQIPFRAGGRSFDSPIPAALHRPHSWYQYKSLTTQDVWCPLDGTAEYIRSSESLRLLWGPAECM